MSIETVSGPGRGPVWRSRGVALVDQGFSSLSNVLAVLLVASALDNETLFGRFSLAYAVLVAVLGVSRSWFGTRLSLVPDRAAVRDEAQAVLGSLVILALPLIVFVMVFSWSLTGGSSRSMVLVVALATPVVCLQDALRFAAVAAGRPMAALVSDAVWTVGLVALFPVATHVSSTFVMWMWLIAALAAFVVLMYGLRVRPNLGSGWRGLRERHRTGESVSIGTVVTLAASLLVTSMVAAMLTDADVGSMRGASTLLGPLNVVMAFVALALTPALLRRSRPRDLRFCVAVASVTLSAVVVWGVVVLLLPNWVGERLLHESWAGARSVLPFAVLEYAGLAVATAWTLGLKVRRENGMLVRQKLAVAVLMVVGGGVGAIVIGDVRAVSAGLAVAAAAGVLLGWHNLFTSLRRAGRARVEVETPVSL